jgi:hypothetical protein
VLATGLTRMLGQVEVLARKPNIHATTFPS